MIWWAAKVSYFSKTKVFLLLPADFWVRAKRVHKRIQIRMKFSLCFVSSWRSTNASYLPSTWNGYHKNTNSYMMTTNGTNTQFTHRTRYYKMNRTKKDISMFLLWATLKFKLNWRQFKVDCSRCWWESCDKYKVINSLLYCSGASWWDTILR